MDDNNNAKIDYEAMLEAALNKMKSILNDEFEYFKYMKAVNDYTEVITLVSKNMMSMSVSDQLSLLKAVCYQGAICEKLQEKYKFEKEESHEES